uniref:hypothetical protein n=1 Tax=Streptomyces triticisoli TaxID=2182797 RepID=UPI001300B29E
RRGQRRLAESAAGVRHRLPEPAGPLRRGVFLLAAGAVLCAVAGSAVGQGLSGVRADERRAAGAERVTAEVTGRYDASVRLRTDDARSVTVDAEFPEDYPVGTTLTVLEDGPWRRLAAEPYDPWAWQLLALAAGLPGISLLTTGVLAYRRGAALRRGPVPALRVLERVDRDGRSWIHATDDPSGRTPLFSCHCARVLPDEGKHAEHTEEDEDEDEGGDDDRAFDTRLYEAVVFGAPYEGGELVFLAAGSDGDPVVTRTVGPVRLPGTGRGRMGHGPKPAAEGESAGAELPPDDRVAEVAAALKPTGRPMRWGAGRVARIYGLALTAGMVSGIELAVDAVAADGFRWDNLFRFGLIFLIGPAAVLLNWRITADSAGLWLTGVWKVRHVPWERLRAVRYTAYGSVEVRVRGEDPWQLSLPAWHWAARRLGLRLPYTRMFEELAALHAHPELRPTEQSPPRGRGLPMGPALALLLGLLVLLPFLG